MRRMRWRPAVAALPAALLLVAACGEGRPEPGPPGLSPVPVGSPLPPGKADVALRAGRWRSPDGFAPGLSVEVPAGWHSGHRFPDMFDVGRPDGRKDLPLVAVAFSVAAGHDAAATLARLRSAAGTAAGPSVVATFAGRPATRFDVTGGSGELYRSSTGGFGLYADRRQRLRLLVADVGGTVVVVAVVVPDGRRWSALLPDATAVVASARTA